MYYYFPYGIRPGSTEEELNSIDEEVFRNRELISTGKKKKKGNQTFIFIFSK